MAQVKKQKMRLKVGDKVEVIAGDYKGRQGDILKLFPAKQRVLVEDVNMVKKHQKPTNDSPGGIVEQPAPIHISNVMLVDGNGDATRIGSRIEGDKKVRYSKKSDEII